MSLMRKWTTRFAVGIAALSGFGGLALATGVGPASAATTANLSITAGTLAFVSTPAAYTYNVTLTGADQAVAVSEPADISDATGSGAGWNMSASVGAVAWTCGACTGAFSGVQNVHSAPAAPTCDGGSTCTVATQTVGEQVYPINLGTVADEIFDAQANTGIGNETVSLPLQLPVLANTVATGTFTQTVTFTLASTP